MYSFLETTNERWYTLYMYIGYIWIILEKEMSECFLSFQQQAAIMAATAQGTYINPMAAIATHNATINGMVNSGLPPSSGKTISCRTLYSVMCLFVLSNVSSENPHAILYQCFVLEISHLLINFFIIMNVVNIDFRGG